MLALMTLALCTLFTQAAQQKIVFLYGTCSAGKSSLSAHIASQENWKVVASLYWDYLPQIIEERFPEQYMYITQAISHENITYAVYRNYIVFNDDASDIQKDKALESMYVVQDALLKNQDAHKAHMQEFKQYTYDVLTSSFASGMSTVIDLAWYVCLEEIKELYDGPITQALVYCPFEVVMQRIVQRNQKAVADDTAVNRRFFKEGISTFLRLYDFSEDARGAIDTISQDSLEQTFELIAAHIGEQHPHIKELSLIELEEQKARLLEKFVHASTLYVVPRIVYDVLVNTQELAPLAAAEKIINN